jgi:hypothetical protein
MSDIKEDFNTFYVKQMVQLIQNDINLMIEDNINDPFEWEMRILEKHCDFYSNYPFLVKKLCKRDDLNMLYTMLDNLEQIQSGDKKITDVEMDLGNNLANKYLYPKLK